MSKIAIFPGTFDPFTVGHESIVNRALKLFDKIIIGVGYNSGKSTYLSIDSRLNLIKDVFKGNDKIEVTRYEGLTVEFCARMNAGYLLRGLRTAADFEYERAIAQVNKAMRPEIESVFLLTAPEYTPVNSTIVRDILLHGGDASKFLPKGVDIKKYL
jgi:pantetheine-phosphate adenylyltransferase